MIMIFFLINKFFLILKFKEKKIFIIVNNLFFYNVFKVNKYLSYQIFFIIIRLKAMSKDFFYFFIVIYT